jgi:LemA protein
MGKLGALGCVLVLLGVVVVALLAGVAINNKIVALGQGVDAQWANVESAYQRRADLIPNLVSTVQGAAGFEKSTLEAVTQARASVGQMKVTPEVLNDPQAFAKWQAAQDGLTSALQRLLVVSEQYPDLKATAAFRDLQAQLEGTENRINVERNRFNEAAQSYNTTIAQFPASVVAGFRGFKPKAYFHAAAGSEQAPKVQFNFGTSPAPAASPAR